MLLVFLKRIRDALVLLTIALLPWQARLIFHAGSLGGVPWEGGTTALSVVEMVLLLALLLHLMLKISGFEKTKTPMSSWMWLWIAFLGWAACSVFWARQRDASLIAVFHLLEGLALAWMVWDIELRIRDMLKAFVIGQTVNAALGVWQFLSQSTFASSLLGIALHPAGHPGTAVIETIGGRWLRAYGLLPHPNIFGGFAAAGIFAGMALMVSSTRRSQRIWIVSAQTISAAALVVSFSRAAWIALAVAVIISAARRKRWSVYARTAYGFSFFPMMLITAIAIITMHGLLLPRFTGSGRIEGQSLSGHALSITQAAQLFMLHPAFGVGAGNFQPAAFDEATPKLDDVYLYQPAHLVPALAAAELGFLGVMLLLGAGFFWCWEIRAMSRRAAEPIAQVILAAPLIVIIIGLFDHWPLTILPGVLLTGLLFGLSLKAENLMVGTSFANDVP